MSDPCENAQTTVLVGGTLIDGTGLGPVKDSVVVITGAKIAEVGSSKGVQIPGDARVLDTRGKWILPGFIDLHAHLTCPEDAEQQRSHTDSLLTLRALRFMNQLLRCGVTSVRDVGSPIEPMGALTAARSLGYTDTVRLFSCGPLLTVSGGHGAGTDGTLEVDGPWAFRRAVRRVYRAGFRYVKLSPTYTREEVDAALDEASTLGMSVTVHGGGVSDTTPTSMTRIAVEAGAPCIEHLNQMDEEVLDLMAERGVHVVPTLAIYRALYEGDFIPRRMIEERNWCLEMHEDLFRMARARGILMGIGVDAVGAFTRQYPDLYFDEMKYHVQLGATKMEAIVAATRNGAIILNRCDLGTLEPNKGADLQVLGSNPLDSLDALGSPEAVMVEGNMHRFA